MATSQGPVLSSAWLWLLTGANKSLMWQQNEFLNRSVHFHRNQTQVLEGVLFEAAVYIRIRLSLPSLLWLFIDHQSPILYTGYLHCKLLPICIIWADLCCKKSLFGSLLDRLVDTINMVDVAIVIIEMRHWSREHITTDNKSQCMVSWQSPISRMFSRRINNEKRDEQWVSI